MAVHVRLKRFGNNPKGRPHFRICVFDDRKGRDSKPLEELGFYNAVDGSKKIDIERVEFWVKRGAQLSSTVKSLMKNLKKEGNNAAIPSR
ncbi:MAG: 30S ribosomal protein S16 [Candidatus Omnitrophota bacterium]